MVDNYDDNVTAAMRLLLDAGFEVVHSQEPTTPLLQRVQQGLRTVGLQPERGHLCVRLRVLQHALGDAVAKFFRRTVKKMPKDDEQEEKNIPYQDKKPEKGDDDLLPAGA
jgi:hypothetical protein